ncbi:uncharacterized protein LOC126982938 [Eriocheir sinensis]|uniref:uncharacterized protein LOC126982938 n=1 Tax=Eriocheir sinensis TaxID=95602 RepID=UPI0021C69E45|nr:uncharacterized protein LOC126982938 [Eriocheir sinensis]
MSHDQVFITVAGPLPGSLDLGSWGLFYTRPYSKEPLRCYNCQQFGHHRARCSRPPVCGICSARHDTERCLTKYKASQEITSKCPNCHQEHHVWNKNCTNRRALVDRQRIVQQRWVVTHRPAPPGTFRWGSQLPPAPTEVPTAHLPQPADQAPPAPPPPASQPRSITTAAPAAAPPGHILITREVMVGLLEGFGRIIASVLKSDVEPKVFSDAAKEVVGSLFPETPARQAATPPTQTNSLGGPSPTPPTPPPPALASAPSKPPALTRAGPLAPLTTPPTVATAQLPRLETPPPAPTSLPTTGLLTRPVMNRDPRSRTMSL